MAIQQRVDAQIGILSFSACRENILLWTHYANRHYGVCLEFDMVQWTKDKRLGYELDSVKYCTTRPLLTLSQPEQAETKTLEKVAFTKHQDWEYEKEWRMVCSFKNRFNPYLSFPVLALTGVIFGLRTRECDKHVVERSLCAAGYSLTLSEAREDHDQFILEISDAKKIQCGRTAAQSNIVVP